MAIAETAWDASAEKEVADSFRASVDIFERMATPLYREFSLHAPQDPELLELAWHGMAGARPTHLYSAAHYLLLGQQTAGQQSAGQQRDPLARYFATLVDAPLPPAGAYPHLARFCRAHRGAVLELLKTRTVQTTYAERCRAILPPMCEVARAAGNVPLNLVEIGCSAGVLLVFDKFAYDLNRQGVVGAADSPLLLRGELRGGPELFIPRIGKRIGLDLHPIDTHSEEERRWLLALCFPELRDEQARLAQAMEVIAATEITLHEGDALRNLRLAMAEAPDPLCVLHSACLFYWPPEARLALEAMLIEASQTREFWRIGIEPTDSFGTWMKGENRPADGGGQPASIQKNGGINIFHYKDGSATHRFAGGISSDYGTITWSEPDLETRRM